MKFTRTSIIKAVEAVMSLNCRKATVYLGSRAVVKATALHRQHKNARSTTILLTCGQPNAIERRFIKQCFKVGEPLPVRKVQIRWWPKK